MFGLTPLAWACLGLAAFVVGLSKTSIAGLGSVAVVLFALVLPAKESTAAVLLLLICGDLVAVAVYRRQADWGQLRRLLPAVLPGIGLGAVFLAFTSDRVLLLAIGGLVLAAVLLQLGLRRHSARLDAAARAPAGPAAAPSAAPPAAAASPPLAPAPAGAAPSPGPSSADRRRPPGGHPLAAVGAGLAAGFTTMVANAAGPVMALYLLAVKADKNRFVATGAWFFLVVNVAKTPFSAGLGLIHTDTLALLATLVPVVLVGTWCGRRFLRSLSQRHFDRLVIAASALSGAILVAKGLFAPGS